MNAHKPCPDITLIINGFLLFLLSHLLRGAETSRSVSKFLR